MVQRGHEVDARHEIITWKPPEEAWEEVNYVSAGIILDLLEEIDRLKRRIERFESSSER